MSDMLVIYTFPCEGDHPDIGKHGNHILFEGGYLQCILANIIGIVVIIKNTAPKK
jgi:hypothetical protein